MKQKTELGDHPNLFITFLLNCS